MALDELRTKERRGRARMVRVVNALCTTIVSVTDARREIEALEQELRNLEAEGDQAL